MTQRSDPCSIQSLDSAHLLPTDSKGLGRCGLHLGSGRLGRRCTALGCCQPGTLGRPRRLKGHIRLRAVVSGAFQRLRIALATVAWRCGLFRVLTC